MHGLLFSYQSDRGVGLNIDFAQRFRPLLWMSLPTPKFAILLTVQVEQYECGSAVPWYYQSNSFLSTFTVTKCSGIEWGGWKMLLTRERWEIQEILHLGNLKGRDHNGDGCITAENNIAVDLQDGMAVLLLFICYLQLGGHPVAAVSYTCTCNTISRSANCSFIYGWVGLHGKHVEAIFQLNPKKAQFWP